MVTKLFKTKKLAEEYISENYPESRTQSFALYDTDNWDDVDMPNLQWSGETPGLRILDDDLNDIDRVAWMWEGDDAYELHVGNDAPIVFDNNYDAREAYDKAVEDEKYEDEPRVVKLFCNGEDITE